MPGVQRCEAVERQFRFRVTVLSWWQVRIYLSGRGLRLTPTVHRVQRVLRASRFTGRHATASPILRGGGPTWFATTSTLLAGIAPLLLISSTPLSRGSSPAWIWAWVFTILVGLRYAWLVADGARRLFEVVFWLFAYVFLGLAPLVQMRSGIYPGTTLDLDLSRNGTAMVVIILGAAAFAVGSAAASSTPHDRPAGSAPKVRPARVLILSLCSLVFAAFYVSRVGLGTVLSSRSARSVAEVAQWPNPPVTAVVAALATFPLVAAFAALLVLRRQQRQVRPLVLLPVVLGALIVLSNPVSSPRYVAGTAALSSLVALGAVATVRRLRVFTVVLAVGLVLVFPYADIARNVGQSGSDKTGGPAVVLSSPDFDAFDQINNSLAYVDKTSPVPGRQLFGALLFFVPRNVWSGKPQDTGIALADFRGYKVTNLSAPLWAEAYVNGGWVGLVGLMAVLGAAVRRWDDRADRVRPRPNSPGVLATTLPFYVIIMLRGSLLQSMAGFTVLVVCGRFVAAPGAAELTG